MSRLGGESQPKLPNHRLKQAPRDVEELCRAGRERRKLLERLRKIEPFR